MMIKGLSKQKCLPDDWGDGYPNVWLGVTCEDREYGYPRIDALCEIPAKVHFISAEPLLESLIDISLDGVDWVIVGGESGPGFRKMEESWAYELVDICNDENIPVRTKAVQ